MAEPELYGLQPNFGVVKGTHNTYMLSFYHQLHCLRELQVQFVALSANHSTVNVELVHAEHCFNYLRQAIMCCGDAAVEGLDAHFERGESPIRGYGTQHSCKNWQEITQWMHDNEAN